MSGPAAVFALQRQHDQHRNAPACGQAQAEPQPVPVRARGVPGAGGLRPSQLPAVAAVTDVVGRGGGRPLAPNVRAEMESRFGADFAAVRIHTDERAARSAAAVAADAYTVGHEIVFRHGSPVPGRSGGLLTLAHELAHVEQQRAGPVPGTPAGGGLMLSDPSDPFERAAEATARAVMTGQPPPARAAAASSERASSRPATTTVQRDVDPGANPDGQPGSDPGQADTPQSCAGWESDPQSLCIRVAQTFLQDAQGLTVGSADKVVKDEKDPTGKHWLVRFPEAKDGIVYWIVVDLSQVPGKVSAVGGLPQKECTYTYSCSTSGAITFNLIACHPT